MHTCSEGHTSAAVRVLLRAGKIKKLSSGYNPSSSQKTNFSFLFVALSRCLLSVFLCCIWQAAAELYGRRVQIFVSDGGDAPVYELGRVESASASVGLSGSAVSIYLSLYLSIYLYICISVYMYMYIYLSIYLSIYLYICIYVYVYVYMYMCICMSAGRRVGHSPAESGVESVSV